jgi:DNA-binding CsgD family transcriptional regulator
VVELGTITGRMQIGGEAIAVAPVLHDRDAECTRVQALLDQARGARRSGVLVIRGEAGIGKSALLRDATERAADLPVLRATGLESESELAYAGLHQLLLPVLDRLDVLPEPQADALRSAFGLAPARAGDRFLVSLATLSLVSEVAGECGLLCVIDDAQWLDGPSADALLFVARRLEAEGVVMLIAVRDDVLRAFDAADLEEMALRPLSPAAAAAVLAERAGAALSDAVRGELVARCGGYPLALVELPALLSAEQLSGRLPLVEPLPMGTGMERAFLTRVRELDDDAQAILLVAAAEDAGELHTVQRAATELGLDPDLLDQLEDTNLVRIADTTVEFHHPLVRSAVYRSARARDRRRAHLAIAAVVGDDDRRAWHRAVAADAPDEAIAADLERMADGARDRGGHAAAAIALERAARLTPGDEERGRRLVAAAEAHWLAGHAQHVLTLLDQAEALIRAPRLQGCAALIRGSVALQRGASPRAYDVLARGAEQAAEADPRLALHLLARAGEATWAAGNGAWNAALAARAQAMGHDGDDESRLMVEVITGSAQLMQGDFARGGPTLRHVLELADRIAAPRHLILGAEAALLLGDSAAAHVRCLRAVELLRGAGAVGELPLALQVLASIEGLRGHLASATAHSDEGHRLASDAESGLSMRLGTLAQIDAVRGRAAACREHARLALEQAEVRGLAMQAAAAHWALSRLHLGDGRPSDAIVHLTVIADPGTRASHPFMALLSGADLVEVAVRLGRREVAEGVVDVLARWAQGTGSAYPLALVARCQALLAERPAVADERFDEALVHHHGQGMPFERSRTALLFGEHLRRTRRPRAAREHLRAARDTFEAIGAVPWWRRAAAELRASGEITRSPDADGRAELTSQELQIARFVADGATNREVAAKLFLSPKTVEYHLGKVFAKLGLTSRVELARAMAGLPEAPGLGSD